MPDIQVKQVRRKRFSEVGVAPKKQVPAPPEFWEMLKRLIADVKRVSKVKLTIAHILREGGRRYALSLRAQMNKANSGSYHARKRRDAFQ